MMWALAFIVILGAGVPMAGWWFSRRPRPLEGADRGYDEIDRWLVDEFGLGWRARSRVREAVLAGRPEPGPALEAATRALAAQVSAGRFRTLPLARGMGTVQLGLGPIYVVFGIVVLVMSSQTGKWALGVLAVLNGSLMTFAGVVNTFRTPWRVRRNAEAILRSGPSIPSGEAAPQDR